MEKGVVRVGRNKASGWYSLSHMNSSEFIVAISALGLPIPENLKTPKAVVETVVPAEGVASVSENTAPFVLEVPEP